MIDRKLGRFLQQGLSIHVGTRDESLNPTGARAAAAIVEPGGQHLVVYVAEAAAARLLENLRSNGQIAIGFGRPEDERACQVKGMVLDIREAEASERATVEGQWQGLMEQFARIGIPPAVAAGWTYWPAQAIRVKVTAVFEQTPGPQAGTPLA
ncbi:MAG TPA: hypothetical protein VM364_09555 [Vicinamibacterales bacterium]|nr:hypothetical protein [Vicinamibacterales bacterium]